METRFGVELGVKNISYYKPLIQKEPPVPKEVPIPGDVYENKQYREQEMAANAILPTQIKSTYNIKGNIVNFQA